MSGNSPSVTPKRIAAVAMAVVMAFSMVGMAFVGGAAADTDQSGTLDSIIEDEFDLSDRVNVEEEGEVRLFDSEFDHGNVTIAQDGSADFDVDSEIDESGNDFAGVVVSGDRVGELTGFDDNIEGQEVDLLADLDGFEIDGEDDDNFGTQGNDDVDGAYPVILLELDTKSDYSSQLSDVDGEADFIAIADTIDDDVAVVDSEGNALAGDTESDFDAAIDELIDEGGLENEFIDGVSFAAGVGLSDAFTGENVDGEGSDIGNTDDTDFDSFDDDVTDLQVEIDGTDAFIHSEKITLNPGDDEEYFSSLTANELDGVGDDGALGVAEDGDEIAIANGTYETFENDEIEIEDDVTIVGDNDNAVDDRLDRALEFDVDPQADPVNESILRAQVNLGDSVDSFTVEDMVMFTDHSDDDYILELGDDEDANPDDLSVENTILQSDFDDQDTGIEVDTGDESNDVTLDEVAVLPGDSEFTENNLLNVEDNDLTAVDIVDVEDPEDVTIDDGYFLGFETVINDQTEELDLEDIANNALDGVIQGESYDLTTELISTQAVIPLDDSDEFVGDSIPGSVVDADDRGDTEALEVSAGTYDHSNTVNDGAQLDLESASVEGAGSGSTILLDHAEGSQDIVIDASAEITFDGFTVDDSANIDNIDISGDDEPITVDDIVSIGGGGDVDLNTDDGDVVTVQNSVFTGEVDIDGVEQEGDVTVDSVSTESISVDAAENDDADEGLNSITVDDVSDVDANDAIDLNGIGAEVTESVEVTDSTLKGSLLLTDMEETSDSDDAIVEVDITNNNITELGSETGIELSHDDAGESDGVVIDELEISENYIEGDDSEFDAIELDITGQGGAGFLAGDRDNLVTISDNIILGGELGAGDGTGLSVTEQFDIVQEAEDDEDAIDPRVTDNVFDGHAKNLELPADDGPETQSLNFIAENEFGTLAVAFDEAPSFDDDEINTIVDGQDVSSEIDTSLVLEDDAVHGSVAVAVEDDAGESDEPATVLVDELLESEDVPDNLPAFEEDKLSDIYDEGEQIDLDGGAPDDFAPITVEGVDRDNVIVDAHFRFEDGGTDEINNHDISTLTIDASDDPDGDSVIDLAAPNAQTDITEVTVDTDDKDGIVAENTGDVYNITVEDSAIEVTGTNDGIVLDTDNSADQFRIFGTEVRGDNVYEGDDSIGLKIDVDEDIGPDNGALEVRDNTFANFTTQVDTSFQADGLLEEKFTDLIDENTYEQQVIYENESAFNVAQNTSLQGDNVDGEEEDRVANIYGSIAKADDDLGEFEIEDDLGELVVNVTPGTYDEVDTVTIDTPDDASDSENFDVRFTTVVDERAEILVEEAVGVDFDDPDGDSSGDVAVVFDSIDVDVNPFADPGVDVTVDDVNNPQEVVEISVEDGEFSGINTTGDAGDQDLVVSNVHVDVGTDIGANADDVDAVGDVSSGTTTPEDLFVDANETVVEQVEDFVKPGQFGIGVEELDGTDAADQLTLDNVDVANAETGLVNEHGESDADIFYNNSDISVTEVGIDLAPDDSNGDIFVTNTEFDADSGLIDADSVGLDIPDSDADVGELRFQDSSEVSGDEGVNIAEDGVSDVIFDGTDVIGEYGAGLTIDDDSVTLEVIDESTVTTNAAGYNATNLENVDSNTVVQNSEYDAQAGQTALYIGEDVDDGDISTITGNALKGNVSDDDAFAIAADAGSLDSDADLTRNFWNDTTGPQGADSAGLGGAVADDAAYDPFLTANHEIGEDATTTTEFSHDVVIPANSRVSVGFPASVSTDDISEMIDTDADGTVFAFNETQQSFEPSPLFTQIDDQEEITDFDAFDAFVIDNREDEDITVTINYANDVEPGNVVDDSYEFVEGLNFVPAAQAGTVDETLFPGDDTDFVQQPFETPENLYGAGGQTEADFADPDEEFGANFRSGVGDTEVHPHVGYLVTVNEEQNVGLEVTQQITTPGPLTVEDVADRTQFAGNPTGTLTAEAESDELQIDPFTVETQDAENVERIQIELDGDEFDAGQFDGDETDVETIASDEEGKISVSGVGTVNVDDVNVVTDEQLEIVLAGPVDVPEDADITFETSVENPVASGNTEDVTMTLQDGDRNGIVTATDEGVNLGAAA